MLLLSRLEVVLLFGRHGQRSWDLLAQAHPAVAAHVSVLSTRHPGRQAFIGTAKQRALWQEQQAEVFEQAGTLLGYRERSDTRARP